MFALFICFYRNIIAFRCIDFWSKHSELGICKHISLAREPPSSPHPVRLQHRRAGAEPPGHAAASPSCLCKCIHVTAPAQALSRVQLFAIPWDFPGKSLQVGCHFLLQRIFPTQGSNPRLLPWQVDSLPRSHRGRPYMSVLFFLIRPAVPFRHICM